MIPLPSSQFELNHYQSRIARLLNLVFWVVALTLAFWHLYFLLKYKINLPISDEWADFSPWRGMSRNLTPRWIFATTNSHPMLLKRLFSWVFLVADGRDFRTETIVQYMAWLPISLATLKAAEKRFLMPLGWAAVLLFTVLHTDNYFWGFMSYLYIHFLLNSIGLFLVCSNNARQVASGYAICALATLQAGSGTATGLAIVVYGAFLCWKVRKNVLSHFIGMGAVLLTLISWLLFVPRDNPFVLVNGPWTPGFWGFVGSSLASALGIGHPRFGRSAIFYAVGFGLVILAVGVLLSYRMIAGSRMQDLKEEVLPRFCLGLFLVSLSAILLIGLGREWENGFDVLRYHIIGLQVIFAVILMILYQISRTGWAVGTKNVCSLAVMATLVLASIPNMRLQARYSAFGSGALEQLRCARSFFAGSHPDSCDGGPYNWGWEAGHYTTAAKVGASYCYLVVPGISPTDTLEKCYEVMQANQAAASKNP